MGRFILSLIISLSFYVDLAIAVPHISKATSVKGAIAYQDDTDNKMFWYIPTIAPIDDVGTGSLKTFNVAYSGIGPPYYACEGAICRPSYGANLGATVNVDLTDRARKDLIKEIAKKFGVQNPSLAPVRLSNVKVESLLVDTLAVSKISQKFTQAFQFKSDAGFTAGSNASNFGANLATTTAGVTGIVPNPSFSVEFRGDAEFAADPWVVEATCILDQAWSHIRASVSASASLGWFKLGEAQYESLTEDLKRNKICTYKEMQGTLDVKNDLLPTLEMMKKLFEEMNSKATAGDGFFKFEPNPDPPEVSAKGASSIWPWTVSVNLGYSSAAFTQKITSTIKVEILAKFNRVVGTTAVMAVKCTDKTKQFFSDLGDPSESCITPAKVKEFRARAGAISEALDARLAELSKSLESGKITEAVYARLRQDALSDAGGRLMLSQQPDGTVNLRQEAH